MRHATITTASTSARQVAMEAYRRVHERVRQKGCARNALRQRAGSKAHALPAADCPMRKAGSELGAAEAKAVQRTPGIRESSLQGVRQCCAAASAVQYYRNPGQTPGPTGTAAADFGQRARLQSYYPSPA